MVKSLTESLVSRKEEERHQMNLNENEQLKRQKAETAQQFTECPDRMLHTPVTSLIATQATARLLWSIMLFGLWPLPSPLQLPSMYEEEKVLRLCYQLSSVTGSLRSTALFGYKGFLLISGIFLAYEIQRQSGKRNFIFSFSDHCVVRLPDHGLHNCPGD
ncbi:hypothetical protein RRG08_057838 [Elysia crispata]|uniref:Uncharacterized protein n=1 Tax=Elysia crispata TaxID=231223 RepID=A0AAE1E8B2_9GAST|nr:hypothetical protein RRG08_057838 [Elysia crispata]